MQQSCANNRQSLTSSYTFDKLLFRDREKSQLFSCLQNSINLFTYGPVGSGRTALLKSAIDEFNSTSQAKAIYIDGILHQTTNSILREIVSSLSSLSAIPKSTSSLIEKLQRKAKGKRLVICIDHFEQLKEVDVIDKVLSLNAQKDLSLGLILTANNKECLNRLSGQARSEIASILHIPRYNTSQVYEILLQNAELKKSSCDKTAVKEISDTCEGNMTRALSLLRASMVETDGGNLSLLGNVSDCPEDEQKLGEDEQVLLQIMKEHRKLKSSELYRLYQKQARQPKSMRSFREFMNRLKNRGLVTFIGTKRWRVYEYCSD